MLFSLDMRRLWPLLLTLAMVAPLAGGWAMPIQDECQDESECEEGGVCDFDCGLCVCCASRPISPTQADAADVLDTPRTSVVVLATAFPPAAPPSGILHVPKSV